MPHNPISKERVQAVLVLFATITTIIFNVLSATGRINDITPAAISAKYPTMLTPAGYAFTIWSVIYLGLAAFTVYQILPAYMMRLKGIRTLYIFSCLLNCSWIYFWHHGQIGICLVLLVSLVLTLIWILITLYRSEEGGPPLFTKVPFGLYAGWATVAAEINILVYLKNIGVDVARSSEIAIGVTMLAAAAILAVLVRWKLKNYMYPLAIAWAATAIAVKQSGNTPIVIASSICVIVGLVMAISFVMEHKGTMDELR